VIVRLLLVSAISLTSLSLSAQITERERPVEWAKLVHGGRFMDRFLPIPVMGELTRDTWGAEGVLPRYTQNGIEDPTNSYWGGNVIVGEDGLYHLFVCGWPEDSPKGHMFWPNSTVFHAVSENSFGPYRIEDVVGPGHNPEAYQLQDGRYVIYVIDGYYISETLEGPWKFGTYEFDARDREIIEGLSNLTFEQREDGSFIMICRGGGVWFSRDGLSPWLQVTDKRVYPDVDGRFEDPLIWRTNVQYHLIVNDWLGRIAWYLRSKDGINWKVDPGEAYLPGIAKYEDGTVVDWFKYERIKVLQDAHGRATQAHFAVIDTVKWNDLENDHHSSKHIVIPLTVGRLISVLNREPITTSTEAIHVRIEAEDGFDPHSDVDLASLRFGAPEEVNYGWGSSVLSTERVENAVIVTFDGHGNGCTEDNFAGKLLGKTTEGAVLFGYARLPGVRYLEPALSARKPVFAAVEGTYQIEIEVQNFGQVASEKAELQLLYREGERELELASGRIPVLEPFEKTVLTLLSSRALEKGRLYQARVLIDPDDVDKVTFNTTIGY